MFKSLLHENYLIVLLKYTFMGSKSSQNAANFHKKNYCGVNFFCYPYTTGYEVSKSTVFGELFLWIFPPSTLLILCSFRYSSTSTCVPNDLNFIRPFCICWKLKLKTKLKPNVKISSISEKLTWIADWWDIIKNE